MTYTGKILKVTSGTLQQGITQWYQVTEEPDDEGFSVVSIVAEQYHPGDSVPVTSPRQEHRWRVAAIPFKEPGVVWEWDDDFKGGRLA